MMSVRNHILKHYFVHRLQCILSITSVLKKMHRIQNSFKHCKPKSGGVLLNIKTCCMYFLLIKMSQLKQLFYFTLCVELKQQCSCIILYFPTIMYRVSFGRQRNTKLDLHPMPLSRVFHQL